MRLSSREVGDSGHRLQALATKKQANRDPALTCGVEVSSWASDSPRRQQGSALKATGPECEDCIVLEAQD